MSEDLKELEDWLGVVTAALAPGERAKLARAMGLELRKSQAARIAAQKNPDGSAYAPRKRRAAKPKPKGLRIKAGAIKRQVRAQAMFRGLRKNAFLKVASSANEASVGFMDPAVARIARVHQYGLRDRVVREPGAPVVAYPARVLLGFTAEDRERLADALIEQLKL